MRHVIYRISKGSGKIFLLQSVLYEMCLCSENDPSVACYNRLLDLTGIGADREGKSNSERASSAVVLEPAGLDDPVESVL